MCDFRFQIPFKITNVHPKFVFYLVLHGTILKYIILVFHFFGNLKRSLGSSIIVVNFFVFFEIDKFYLDLKNWKRKKLNNVPYNIKCSNNSQRELKISFKKKPSVFDQ